MDNSIEALGDTPGVAYVTHRKEGAFSEQGQTHCGAVAIDEHWFLVARHCVDGHRWADLVFETGSRKVGSGTSGIERRGSVALCPAISVPGSLEADIALVHIETGLPPALIFPDLFENPDPSALGIPAAAYLASWPAGRTALGQPPLRSLPISLDAATHRGHLIASITATNQRAPCSGESGAAVYLEREGKPVLAALLSGIITPAWADADGRPKCRSPQLRLLLSPLAPWKDWIADTIATCRITPERCARPG